MPETIHAHGETVQVQYLKTLENGGARFDITGPAGRRWRIDVTLHGNHSLVTSWDREGTLADLDEPAWFDDVLTQLERGV